MHELGLMKGALDTALLAAERAGAKRVVALNVVLQDDGYTDPEALALHLELLAQGTMAEGARLTVSRRVSEQQCWSCGARYTGQGFSASCPQCGAAGIPIGRADEFSLDSIEVE